MGWTLELSDQAERDLAEILDHLQEAYLGFGETPAEAVARAALRVERIAAQLSSLLTAPRRGTRHEDLLPDLRHLTMDRAIYWFQVDEALQRIRILGIFFGGQEHHGKMVSRLIAGD